MIGADHGDAREEETAIQLFQQEVGRNKGLESRGSGQRANRRFAPFLS